MLEHMKAPVKAIVGRLEPHLPARALSEARDRVAPRSRALVRPVAEGPRTPGSWTSRAWPSTSAAGIRRGRTWKRRPGSGATRRAGRSRGSRSACSTRGRTLASGEAPSAAARAAAALRAHDRHRGRRPGDVVRRRGARPAAERRVQPRLRDRRRSRASWRSSACRGRCCASRPTRRAPTGSRGSATWRPTAPSTLVASAGQNGAHRLSARDPKALEPGEVFPLEIEMHFTSWVFPKGHRLRLAVSNAQWPMIWPTP